LFVNVIRYFLVIKELWSLEFSGLKSGDLVDETRAIGKQWRLDVSEGY